MTRYAPPAVGYSIGALLLLVILASGALTSPALPLLVPWFVWIAAKRPPRSTMTLAVGSAAVLLVGEIGRDGIAGRDLLALGSVAAAPVLPVLWWHRQASRQADRTAELDAILAEEARGERQLPAAAAAGRLTDLRRLLAAAAERTGASRVTLWDVDDAAQAAVARASSGRSVPPAPVALTGDPLGWVWNEGVPVRLDRTPAWAATGASVHALRLDRAGTGTALVSWEFEGEAAPDVAADLQAATDHLGAEVALHDRSVALAMDRRRTAVLLDTLRRIPAVTAPLEFAGELLAGAVDLADATGAVLATWRDEVGRVLATAGEDGGPAAGKEFGPMESELALAARAGAELLRSPRDPRGLPVAAPGELWVAPPRTLVVLPLRTSQGVVGVLGVWRATTSGFDPDALDLLRTLAPHAALQLEQAMEYGRLRDTAERDPLTGLRNRRAFDRALAAEAARLDRYGHPMALLVIDIDHFKRINDRHGHEAGDAVLQRLAVLIESEIRDLDVAARFGGEEFVVLLPETGIAAATEVAERLRRAVESTEISWSGTALTVHISVGVSACPAAVADPKMLVRSADTALYQAKHDGRNRVIAAPAAA